MSNKELIISLVAGLKALGFGADEEINGADVVDYLNEVFPELEEATRE